MLFPCPQASFFRASHAFQVTWSERFAFLPAVVSDTSTKSIDREGLERRCGGTWQTMIHLTPPPPPPRIVVNFPWDYCNTQEKLKAMVLKNVGGGGGVKEGRVLWAM